jgi:hypothetical protein
MKSADGLLLSLIFFVNIGNRNVKERTKEKDYIFFVLFKGTGYVFALISIPIENTNIFIWKFQLDRPSFSLTLLLSHIDPIGPSKGRRMIHFNQSIYIL